MIKSDLAKVTLILITLMHMISADAGMVKKAIGGAALLVGAKTAASAYVNEKFRPKDAVAADCTKGKFADAEMVRKIIESQAVAQRIGVKKVFNISNPHRYLVFVALDGTRNHGEAFTPAGYGLWPTPRYSPDECLERVRAKRASDGNLVVINIPTNVRILANSVFTIGSFHNVMAIYERGVGTEPNLNPASTLNNLLDSGAGQGLMVQVSLAYEQIEKFVRKTKQVDQEATFVFVTTGFSRGAAAVRVLHNRLLSEGVWDESSAYLIAPGAAEIGASVLFDTVTSQMLEIDPRLYDIPLNITQVLHLTAANEYRVAFPLSRAYGANVAEISIPGAHSDIGGSYAPDGISAVTLQIARRYLADAGVPLSILSDDLKPNPNKYIIHDSRWYPTMPFDEQLQRGRVVKN